MERSAAAAKVLLVEDRPLLVQGLQRHLREAGVATRLADLGHPGTFARQAHWCDLALVDVDLGGDGAGVAIVGTLQTEGTRVVALCDLRRPLTIVAALGAGAVRYVTKSDPVDHLIATLCDNSPDDSSSCVLTDLDIDADVLDAFASLTPCEQDVLAAILRGAAPKRIALDRGVSVGTVRTQIREILRKLGVHSQLQAVALARDHGWCQGVVDRAAGI